MKKALTIALSVSILVVLLAACSDVKDSQPDITNPDITDSVSQIVETDAYNREMLADDLPQYDMEGDEFRILVGVTMEPYLMSHEINGEVINDALYAATTATEERFNVKLTPVYFDAATMTYQAECRNIIMAGDDVFDLATIHDLSAAQLSLEGLLVNIYDIPHLSFDKPWWQQKTIDSLTYLDQMFLFTSSISLRGLNDIRVMYFNKDIVEDYNIDSPYDKVFDGQWTLDYFISISKDVYQDLNGDGTADDGDLYGFYKTGSFYCYLETFGIDSLKTGSDGLLELGINNQRTITVIEKLYNLLFETRGGRYFASPTTDVDEEHIIFAKGNIMFCYHRLGAAVQNFRHTDIDYGILPMPKYDEASDYTAACTDRPFFVPITNPDLIRTGIIIESMSAEGYKRAFPAYYEIALKNKFLYDNESVRILELIYENTVLSFSYIYEKFPGFNQTLTNLFKESQPPSSDFASYYAKNEAAALARIEEITKAFQDAKNK